MTKIQYAVVSTLSVVALSVLGACGQNKSVLPTHNNVPVADLVPGTTSTSTELEGEWISRCSSFTQPSNGVVWSFITTLKVTGSTFNMRDQWYSGNGCQTAVDAYIYSGSLAIGGNGETIPGTKQLDFAVASTKYVDQNNSESAVSSAPKYMAVFEVVNNELTISKLRSDVRSSTFEQATVYTRRP